MIDRVPVKDRRSVMPLRSEQTQAQIAFNGQIAAMKAALEGMQRAVNVAGRSLTRTFKTWRESMERSGIDVDALVGQRYEQPVIIDDPPPRCRCVIVPVQVPLKPVPPWVQDDIDKLFATRRAPLIPPAAQRRIAETSRRILAELSPGPGRDHG